MKRALVTGGTRGIGLATVRALIERGYLVTATYLRDEEEASRARALVPSAAFVRSDASSEEEVKKLFFGIPRLDVLVLNAGTESFSQIQDVTEEEYARVMDANVKGAVLTAKHAVPRMLGGGAIVTVSSVWGERGGSCESVYSASKGAILAFTKALSKELAPTVTVNCVSPGVIDTRMNARLSNKERAALEEEIPLGRFGTPEEVASAIVFLAEHPYITGQILGVNGGFSV